MTRQACTLPHLHMIIHGFVFLNLKNWLISIICKSAWPFASLIYSRLPGLLKRQQNLTSHGQKYHDKIPVLLCRGLIIIWKRLVINDLKIIGFSVCQDFRRSIFEKRTILTDQMFVNNIDWIYWTLKQPLWKKYSCHHCFCRLFCLLIILLDRTILLRTLIR